MIGKQMNLFDDVDSAEVSQEDLEYENFVEKFKPKKTTDDCYTPPLIYETVKDWACTKYGIDPDRIVRPFWPGADYKVFPYPEGCVVLDNPPFSILSQIIEFYQRRSIPFFLFAPSLTVFSGRTSVMKTNHIVCGANVTYENGAVVRTAFITSFGGDIVAQTAPDLGRAISDASAILRPASAIPCYEYPPNVLTAAMLQRLSKYGIEFSVRASDCIHIRALDSQKAARKEIFGSGLLLSESSAAEKAIAEKLAEAAATAQKEAPHRVGTVSQGVKNYCRAVRDGSACLRFPGRGS